ncbi:30S ribosomal protein S17 [Candidatus Parcubacteria bacterium]|nr:30S ribosomal protein S17 [Candidatus Parcubacteria bacterium]
MTAEIQTKKKTFTGIVASDKMKDTAVVVVERYTKHPKYQKFIQSRKRYKAHDVGNTAKVGDKVVIEETRPISRHKTFKIKEIMK